VSWGKGLTGRGWLCLAGGVVSCAVRFVGIYAVRAGRRSGTGLQYGPFTCPTHIFGSKSTWRSLMENLSSLNSYNFF
jgi:hypothetical protein